MSDLESTDEAPRTRLVREPGRFFFISGLAHLTSRGDLFSSLRPPPIGNAAKEEKHVDIAKNLNGRKERRTPALLLKQALQEQPGFTFDSQDYLRGSFVVLPGHRSQAAALLFDNSRVEDRFSESTPIRINLAPDHIPAPQFLGMAKVDDRAPTDQSVLEYGMMWDGKEYRWDSPYSAMFDSDRGFVEQIESTFVVANSSSEPAGFFHFGLELIRPSGWGDPCVKIDLRLIYVRPIFWKGTASKGLDLTIALSKFLTGVFAKVFKKYRGELPLSVVIYADFESRGGGRIGNYVRDDLEFLFHALREDLPHKAHKLGHINAEMGY
jgi:hypothetical protein